MLPFTYELNSGRILEIDHDRTFEGLREPDVLISEEASLITGLTAEMVAGKTINATVVDALIADADLIVAHNASFDRVMVKNTGRPLPRNLERPNNWERQMHAEQREKRSQSRRAEDRTAFWERVVEHSPEFFSVQGLVPNGAFSQWLTPEHAPNLVVSIYIALTGVGVFLRGRRGTTPADILEYFEAKQIDFKALVENEMYDPSSSRHPGLSLEIDVTDHANLDEAVEWLCRKERVWLAATDQVFGETD